MKDRLLRIAIHRYWLRGNPLPVDLAARLDAEGLDLTALENTYAS